GTGSVRRYVVSNVVPVAEIGAAPVASSEDLYAGPDEACVLYAGRLDDGKNAECLVRALSQVRSSKPFRALICGDGPLRSRIEHVIEASGIRERVRVAGYVHNLWSLLKRADVLVSP